jgi:hypothetical protein
LSEDSLEEKAIELVKSRPNGVLQSDLWKDLGIDSRKCSRVIAKLEADGKIKRTWETVKGTRTYRISYLPQKKEAPRKEVDFSVIMAGNIVAPCIGCTYECEPDYCPDLGNWVELLTRTPLAELPSEVTRKARKPEPVEEEPEEVEQVEEEPVPVKAKVPIKVPAKVPAKAPIKAPVKAPVKASAKAPAKAPVKEETPAAPAKKKPAAEAKKAAKPEKAKPLKEEKPEPKPAKSGTAKAKKPVKGGKK